MSDLTTERKHYLLRLPLAGPSVISVLHPSAEEINKQIQSVMNATANHQFGMLNAPNDPPSNNPIQQSQWNLSNQFPFNLNNPNVQQPLNIPFNLINPTTPIQPNFNSVNNNPKNTLNYGPPRAIRTKRPNPETCINPANSNDMYNLTGSLDFSLSPPPPPPPKSDDETVNVSQHEDQPASQSEYDRKSTEKGLILDFSILWIIILYINWHCSKI